MVRLKVIYRRFLTLIAWSTYRDVLDIEIMSRIASLCEWGASSLHVVPFINYSSGVSPKLVTSILLTIKMDWCEWSALSKNTRNWCLWTITLKPLKPFGEESTALTPRLFYLLSILSLCLFQRILWVGERVTAPWAFKKGYTLKFWYCMAIHIPY